MPMSRYSKDNNSSRRKSSFTSLFTFNSGKKTNPSTKGLMSVPNTPLRSSGLADAQGHHNYSGQSAVQPPSIRRLSSDPTAANQSLRHSGQVQQEYYNSYYSSLISIPPERSSDLPGDGQQPSQLHSPASETSSALHPYAYRVSTPPSLEPPRSAPLYPSASARAGPSGLASPPVPMQQSPHITLHPPANISLKNSVSTPNLRAGRRSKPSFPKGKDKWLSPETWCDALLFPRPRFKIKQDSDSFSAGSGRIVSPPGSPVIDQFHNGQDMPSVASRVLQHSRSLFELRSPPPVAGPSALSPPKDRLHAQPENTTPVTDQNRSTESRPSRPKSWALDDLALPSPAPSLARVLEEGQILEHQRKKWQDQAIKSFQNERARSLSRARTKSLTSKQVKRSEAHSRLDFLAARGLLGIKT
ncbi:hypothetical protein VKT23_001685 [Stygiomarasmius scandens]|uniref:Uncharacterized protein n=1 Tax=Marasmiellus scandens TaxID=2682957 RepID=A0ABR1K5V1_9AGAR